MRLQLTTLALLSVAACHASDIVLAATGLPSTLENGNYGSSDETYNGFAIATIAGTPGQWIICDDYSHDTPVPSGNMLYEASSVGGSGSLANVRFTGSNEVQNYDEAAVLVWELYEYVEATGSKASANTITDYQYALWNIFDPYSASANPSGVQVNANQLALQSEALNLVKTQGAALSSAVYPNVRIYTPDPNGGSNGSQEFMQAVAPEPGTLPLAVGAMLVAAGLAMRREMRKRRAA
ncbi:MAG TPA: hypothetical protein VKF41_11170 [Bryobacteraceae bacterium]|nr:hypothetical protein [Bryobacteraceae bacterium]